MSEARRIIKEDVNRGFVQMNCHGEHIYVFDLRKFTKIKTILCGGLLVGIKGGNNEPQILDATD